MLTDLVRTVGDRGKAGPYYRIELPRLGILDSPGNALGEVVTHVLREWEEGGRHEAAEAKVEGHDFARVVLHESVVVHVTEAEAQTVGLDLGPEVGTLLLLRVCENLSQDSSSRNRRGTGQNKGEHLRH